MTLAGRSCKVKTPHWSSHLFCSGSSPYNFLSAGFVLEGPKTGLQDTCKGFIYYGFVAMMRWNLLSCPAQCFFFLGHPSLKSLNTECSWVESGSNHLMEAWNTLIKGVYRGVENILTPKDYLLSLHLCTTSSEWSKMWSFVHQSSLTSSGQTEGLHNALCQCLPWRNKPVFYVCLRSCAQCKIYNRI